MQFVHRGTAAQCFCGCAIAFASFGVQQHLRPYREPESNTLKALVDTQLFLAFLVSFILRVLDVPGFLGSEPFSAEMYGLLLLCSMVLLLIAAVALTAMQIARRQKFRARLLDVDLAGLSSRMYGAEAAPAALLARTPPPARRCRWDRRRTPPPPDQDPVMLPLQFHLQTRFFHLLKQLKVFLNSVAVLLF